MGLFPCPSSPFLPPAVVLQEFSRNGRRVRIVEREGRGRRRARYGLLSSRLPLPSGDTLSAGGEKPRARLMALRGCHGYGEPPWKQPPPPPPHPAESPFILEKHYKNARTSRIKVGQPLCHPSVPAHLHPCLHACRIVPRFCRRPGEGRGKV